MTGTGNRGSATSRVCQVWHSLLARLVGPARVEVDRVKSACGSARLDSMQLARPTFGLAVSRIGSSPS